MGDDLSKIASDLRKELNELTRVFVDKQHGEATAFMVQSQVVKGNIDKLDAFVLSRHDQACLGVLRKKMSQYLDQSETKTLILDYGISDFDYEGNTISAMHSELIGFCERRDILPDLLAALREHRPRVKWPEC